jgi:hypothetical protein
MAGGFGSRGLPLHARQRGDEVLAASPAPASPCPVKHCWVKAPVDGTAARPGLLLEWRKGADGRWVGRVSYAAELRPDRWVIVEEWLGAELLSTA